MKIFLSSCVGPAAESVYCVELGRLAGLCRTEDLKLVSAPEIADLILIVDIFEADLYRRPAPKPDLAKMAGKILRLLRRRCSSDFFAWAS